MFDYSGSCLVTFLEFKYTSNFQGGSSSKVVDCILCLKGYYEWKQAGGIGVWRYGGTVRITSLPKESPSSSFVGSESADESLDESESSQYEQLLEYLHLSSEVSTEGSKAADALIFLFNRFGLGLLQSYLSEKNGIEDWPLNEMVGKIHSVYCLSYHKHTHFIDVIF